MLLTTGLSTTVSLAGCTDSAGDSNTDTTDEPTETDVRTTTGTDEQTVTERETTTRSEGVVADVAVSPTEVTVGEVVTVDASGSERARYVEFDFDGDGTAGHVEESDFVVEYQYPSPGSYTPTVTARGPEGESASVSGETVTVTAADAPVARGTVSATDVTVGDTVTIDASDSENAQYVEFDLTGDGETDLRSRSTFTVDYAFSEAGTYAPRVTVVNDAGRDTVDCEPITVGESDGTVVEVPPTATYLRTNNDAAADTTPVALADVGVAPGDRITLTRLGHFTRGSAYGTAGFGMHGVFASSDRLLGPGERHRVPDAIDAGPAMATSPTYYGGRPTNVAEDFGIATNDRSVLSATVDVPEGATHLFVSARDNLFEDNRDDPRFAVEIRQTPDAVPSEDIDPDESVRTDAARAGGTDGDPSAPVPDVELDVDPRATYLHTNGDDAPGTDPISLDALGVEPGDEVTLVRFGSFGNGQGYGMHALFSQTATLLPAENRNRVPGALSTGRSHRTSNTYSGNEPTDVRGDFLVADHDQTFRSVTVDVPEGAKYLFVAAKDNQYTDNTDDGFGVGFVL